MIKFDEDLVQEYVCNLFAAFLGLSGAKVRRINVNRVDLVKSFPTNIFLQNLASIQKRTSPIKFAHLAEKSEKGSISNLSIKVSTAPADEQQPPAAGASSQGSARASADEGLASASHTDIATYERQSSANPEQRYLSSWFPVLNEEELPANRAVWTSASSSDASVGKAVSLGMTPAASEDHPWCSPTNTDPHI